MSSKHVYFIRHGESVANATGIRQGQETPLTDLGRKQAALIAKRLLGLGIERIVKSPSTRTRETSAVIEQELPGIPVTESSLFIERVNPSTMYGSHQSDPEMMRIWEEIEKNYHLPDWHHSDEENFEDLRNRAIRAIAFLETPPESRILVVTHGLFKKVIFAHVLLGGRLDGRMFWECFVTAKTVANTGIMHLEYTENFHKTGMYWKFHSWNDHAHLESNIKESEELI